MATSKKNIKVEKAPEKTDSLVVNQIIIRAVDRSEKDIADWRIAHRHAEQVVSAQRIRLYDLYSDIELDGHLTGLVQKRIDSVLNKKLRFVRDGTQVDEMEKVLRGKAMRQIITLILESKLWGISGMEFIVGEELRLQRIPRKHIKPTLGRIVKEQTGEDGWEIDSLPLVWVVGDKEDLGLYLKCAPYVLWKRGNMADWAQYIEIFGQPVRVIKYDAHDSKTKMELTEVMDKSGSSLALMIPRQAEFEIMDGKSTNANGELQEKLKNACNDELSVIILGNTETTTSSKSSGYAQSATHSTQQKELLKSDMEDVLNELNCPRFIEILRSYNLPVEGGWFEFEGEVNLDELKARKDIDLAISAKVPIDDDYWYETYKIPKPDNYEELRKKMDDQTAQKMALEQKGKKLKPLAFDLADFFDEAPED